MANISKEALERWKAHVNYVKSATASAVSNNETKAEQLKRIARARKDYNYFV